MIQLNIKVKTMEECKRCGYKWYKRTARPVQCPQCGTKHWDKKRRSIEPGRAPWKIRNEVEK